MGSTSDLSEIGSDIITIPPSTTIGSEINEHIQDENENYPGSAPVIAGDDEVRFGDRRGSHPPTHIFDKDLMKEVLRQATENILDINNQVFGFGMETSAAAGVRNNYDTDNGSKNTNSTNSDIGRNNSNNNTNSSNINLLQPTDDTYDLVKQPTIGKMGKTLRSSPANPAWTVRSPATTFTTN